jgi:hypothetical protein
MVKQLALMLLLIATPSYATTVLLDPGTSSFVYKDFHFDDVAGTEFNGQTISINVNFGAELVAPWVCFDLFLLQDIWNGTPPVSSIVTGEFAGATSPMRQIGSNKAQYHPTWPYYTPEGWSYAPTMTFYEMKAAGTIANGLIDPFVFSSVAFNVTLPETIDTLIGMRLVVSSYGQPFNQSKDFPILVNPTRIPTYNVREVPSTAVYVAVGLVLLAAYFVHRTDPDKDKW